MFNEVISRTFSYACSEENRDEFRREMKPAVLEINSSLNIFKLVDFLLMFTQSICSYSTDCKSQQCVQMFCLFSSRNIPKISASLIFVLFSNSLEPKWNDNNI